MDWNKIVRKSFLSEYFSKRNMKYFVLISLEERRIYFITEHILEILQKRTWNFIIYIIKRSRYIDR